MDKEIEILFEQQIKRLDGDSLLLESLKNKDSPDLYKILGIMEASGSWQEFENLYDKTKPPEPPNEFDQVLKDILNFRKR